MRSGLLFFLAVVVLVITGTPSAVAYGVRSPVPAIPSSPILHVAAESTYPVEPIKFALETRIGLFASGDPVNNLDPDGRFGKAVYKAADDFNLGTRVVGAGQGILGGVGAFGAYTGAAATSPTVVGGVGFAALGTLSLDASQAGFRTMWTGSYTPTMLNNSARAMGATPNQAAGIEIGVAVVVSGGTALATNGPRMMAAITNTTTLSRGTSLAAKGVGRATTDIIAGEKGLINVRSTLDRIAAGGKFPHRNDGSIFKNLEGRLPAQSQSYYKEFVHPTPGVSGPGAQRVIQGQGGELYFTPDHYQSFIPLN
jgi:guanyl-specific ribonuclease Sa